MDKGKKEEQVANADKYGKATDRFGKYVDIILVLLGLSLLSVWGAFGRLGQTSHNTCIKQEEDTAMKFVWIMILTGLTFGLYSSLRNKIKEGSGSEKTVILFVLFAMHSVTLGVVWDTYWHVIDFASTSAACDEFFGQQHMFLNVAFMGIIISAMYVYYAMFDAVESKIGKAIGHGILYAGIVAIFFYYASSDGDDSTTWHDDKHQRTMVYVFGFATLGVYWAMKAYEHSTQGSTFAGFGNSVLDNTLGLLLSIVPRRFDAKDHIDSAGKHRLKARLTYEWLTTLICIAVVLVNIIFAAMVVHTDLEHIGDGTDSTNNANLTNPNNTATGCLGDQHDDVLGMGITVIGFWTLYILLLAVVLTQYMSQFYDAWHAPEKAKEVCVIKWFGNAYYYYRDTLDGFQIPTILVLITWVWLLVGGIMHHSELNDDTCGSNKDHEQVVFWCHSVGVLAVLILFPLLHGSKYGNIEKMINEDLSAPGAKSRWSLTKKAKPKPEDELRPTNRFTTRAQVAVDVNTPLNFA